MLTESEKMIEEFKEKFFEKISKELTGSNYYYVCFAWDKTCDELFGNKE